NTRAFNRSKLTRPYIGGAIQVMLSGSLCYSRPGAEIEERGGGREHDGTQRGMSSMWIDVVQEERAYSHRQTKPPLQTVWPGFCSGAGESRHHGGATGVDCTTAAGENLTAGDLPRHGCRPAVALAVYGGAVPGSARASLCRATKQHAGSDPAAAGG